MQIIVGGLLCEYRDEGKGPAILMLHGWRDRLQTYDALAKELTKKYRVIRVDLPNFGASAHSLKLITLEAYTAWLANLLKELEVKSLRAVVGHSMGGQIAIRAVAEGTLEPDKLVLLASAGIRNSKRWYKLSMKIIAKSLRPFVGRSLRRRFYRFIGSDYSPDLPPELKAVIKNVLETDVQADASRLKVPTVLICGKDDNITPVSYAKRFHELIAGSKLIVLPDTGHDLQHERPEAITKHLLDFLK